MGVFESSVLGNTRVDPTREQRFERRERTRERSRDTVREQDYHSPHFRGLDQEHQEQRWRTIVTGLQFS
jgi:hypothetical protein